MNRENAEKTAMLNGFVDELERIKEAGPLWESVKRVATTDLGGPQGVVKPIQNILHGAGTAAKGPSKGFQAFQKNVKLNPVARA